MDRMTEPIRAYRGDKHLLLRAAREATVLRGRRVPVAEILHEQLAQLRMDEAAGKREGSGTDDG